MLCKKANGFRPWSRTASNHKVGVESLEELREFGSSSGEEVRVFTAEFGIAVGISS